MELAACAPFCNNRLSFLSRGTHCDFLMPRRRSNLIRNLLIVVVLAIMFLMGVAPLLEPLFPVTPEVSVWLGWIRSHVMEVLITLWFFVFGSMVGSFINVVVWRMPRGISVVSSGSACPYCEVPIRLADNIPVFGWLKLRGRCRVCRLPISPRYPIVEGIFGLVFLLMFLVELQSAGANLPWNRRYLSTGILRVVLSPNWELIYIYAYHMLLLVMLLTWVLMAFDRSRIPLKTIVFAWLLGLAAPVAFPVLYPVPWHFVLPDQTLGLLRSEALVTGILGWTLGMGLGLILQIWFNKYPDQANNSRATAFCFATTGLFMGWQFIILTIAVFGLLVLVKQIFAYANRVPISCWVTLSVIVVLCTWKYLQVTGSLTDAWPYWVVLLVIGLLLSRVGASLEMPIPNEGSQQMVSE